MKKILLTIAVSIISSMSFAQLQASLVLSANPPGALMDWADKKEILNLIIVNQSGAAGRFLIKAEFKLTDGTVIGSVDLARARLYNLQGASLILNAGDVIPMNLISFSGKYKTSLDKTGKLPAGTYQLCVRLVAPVSFQPVSEERCRTFTVAAFQLAIPIMPFNEQVLKAEAAQTAITFRWAPLAPTPSAPVTYRILVFEVLENQTPMQALRGNQPLLNKDVIGTTQYIWQPQLGMIDCFPCRDDGLGGDGDAEMKAGVSTSRSNVRTKKMTNAPDSSSGQTIITSESNLKDVPMANKGDTANNPSQKAGVSTSGSNVRTKTFIWTIQCFDNFGRPFSDGNINADGISEPIIFKVEKGNLGKPKYND